MITSNCEWMDRVSALLDGELPPPERPLVEHHLARCATCTNIAQRPEVLKQNSAANTYSLPRLVKENSRTVMLMVGLFGLLNIAVAIPNFIKGNTMGDEMHALRHLAIWQATLGIAVLAVSRQLQFSRFVRVASITFLLATSAAAAYDIATGHSGPWTDPAHLLEIGALVMLLVVSRPQFKALSRMRDSRLNGRRTLQ
jgi:hypothetical protein